ncbi:MAG: response regulator [Egibacteraceae bacterium]
MPRVLVVDDDAAIRVALERAARLEGFAVAALAKVTRAEPDLVDSAAQATFEDAVLLPGRWVTFLWIRRNVAGQTGKAAARLPLSFASEGKLQPARRGGHAAALTPAPVRVALRIPAGQTADAGTGCGLTRLRRKAARHRAEPHAG